MFKEVEPSTSLTTIVSENKEKILLIGLAVVLFNWYRLKEKSKAVEEKRKSIAPQIRPKSKNVSKFSISLSTQSTAKTTQFPLKL